MKFRLELFIVVLVSTLSYSQFSSLDVDMDARSIAMGESFVANPNGIASADDNPATLTAQKGLTVFYNRRNTIPTKRFDEVFFYSCGAALETKYGNFSFLYKHSTNNIFEVGEGFSKLTPRYDYTAVISYAKNIFNNFSFGINLKTFAYKTNINNKYYKEAESNNPILFDIGVLYSADGLIDNPYIKDKVSAGTSLTNFGTDYKVKDFIYINNEQISTLTKLPRLLKLGFAYQLNISSFSKSNFLKLLFTGEYSNLINNYNYAHVSSESCIYYSSYHLSSKNNKSQKDFWGAGFEATVMDILSLRIGGTAYPFYNYYGFKGDFSLRYGAGINLPFSLIADNFPLHICFDYAVMITKDKDNSLDAFNVSINYENPFF